MRKESNFVRNIPLFSAFSAFLVTIILAIAAEPFSPPFGKWTRLSAEPIVSPRGDEFESAGTFNP